MTVEQSTECVVSIRREIRGGRSAMYPRPKALFGKRKQVNR
jgi:hypothetical protein